MTYTTEEHEKDIWWIRHATLKITDYFSTSETIDVALLPVLYDTIENALISTERMKLNRSRKASQENMDYLKKQLEIYLGAVHFLIMHYQINDHVSYDRRYKKSKWGKDKKGPLEELTILNLTKKY